ncbi:hypothetical protein X898_670 [Burkholderia pseudomallei ABCPW 91]|nr:hypothetical protein X898_670 [Burkholderia pseudomallei ABCPW 91]
MPLGPYHFDIMDEYLEELRKKYKDELSRQPGGTKKAIRDLLRRKFRHIGNPGATDDEIDHYLKTRDLLDG